MDELDIVSEIANALPKNKVTLRDWFAGMALSKIAFDTAHVDRCHLIAEKCYKLADAMLEARRVQK